MWDRLCLLLPLVFALSQPMAGAEEGPRVGPPAAETAVGWPFLRGANFDGHSPETGLAETWPAAGPPVLWTLELGQGYSGFVAQGERVYTQRQSLTGQCVVCLQAETGATIWEYRYDFPFEASGLYPGPRSTPTLARGKVYFATPKAEVGCLSEAGKLLWQVDLADRFKIADPGFGYACSPVVFEDKVLLPVGGAGASMVALNADTGDTVWQAGDEKASYTPVYPIKLGDRWQAIGYLENALVGHDLASGRLLWQLRMSHGYDEHAAWPIYREPHLWISAPFQAGCRLLKVPEPRADGKLSKIETVWNERILSNDIASSVLVDGHLFGFDLRDPQAKSHRGSRGQFRCIEFMTGKGSWATTETGHASVIVADGKLILLNDTGDLLLARVSSEKFDLLAKCSVLPGEIGWTPPMLHRRRLYVRNQTRAVCVYLGKPEDLQRAADSRPLLTVKDLPQRSYYDMARLLGVEPEYSMDVPSRASFWNWYLNSMAILAMASCIAYVPQVFFWARFPAATIFRLLAFTGGACGTTLLSLHFGEFTFTWAVPLFVALDLVVSFLSVGQRKPGEEAASPLPQKPNRSAAWLRRLGDLTFLAVGFAYYWLCHRLSLVTQWCFLFGLAPALPALWAGYWLQIRVRWRLTAALIITAARLLGFSAMYGTTVLGIWLKYGIPL